MKKLIVPAICVLVGCAAGAAMPAITAQSYGAPAPGAQRYEAFCETSRNASRINELVATHGAQGFHLTALGTMGNGIACFERPAQ